MIDFSRLESYRENNRIEAKKSLGGFPQSFWETYSAFANTLGGIILLGVEERKDHSLHAVNLPDPRKLTRELWDTLNNPAKVSVNILTSRHVAVERVDGKQIIVITVPRAQRYDKPVYIGGNALTGTYRRCGEGDYRCSTEEIEAMLRDASVKTPDMRVLENFGRDALNPESIKSYRDRMKICRPEHVLEDLPDEDFLAGIGAVGTGKDGKTHPTAAGLVMFGRHSEIVKEYPRFSLSYIDYSGNKTRGNSNWCGNISDFYLFAYEKTVDIAVPLSSVGGNRTDAAPVYRALREALANCLINADYYGKTGIEIIKYRDCITFSNPGSFRIDPERARTGGLSDPRNGALTKMFNLIGAGAGIGSGLPHIFAVWEQRGWLTPSISESFNPDRITLTLSVGKAEKRTPPEAAVELWAQQAAIVEFLTDNTEGTAEEIGRLLGVAKGRTAELLKKLIAADIVVRDGDVYRLKR